MDVDIYIREKNGTRDVRIPWLPERIRYTSGGVIFAEYDILNKGPVAVPTGSGLEGVSWESTFPGKNRTDKSMLRGSAKEPKYYHNIFKEWKQKRTPLQVMVTGNPINIDCFVEDYDGEAVGGFGDWDYKVSFLESRDIEITATKTSNTQKTTTKRSTKESKTYTVKPGDCLWTIAEKLKGSGSSWTSIYNANKTVIEKTAKDHGYSSGSNNGWWIFPGCVLTIP